MCPGMKRKAKKCENTFEKRKRESVVFILLAFTGKGNSNVRNMCTRSKMVVCLSQVCLLVLEMKKKQPTVDCELLRHCSPSRLLLKRWQLVKCLQRPKDELSNQSNETTDPIPALNGSLTNRAEAREDAERDLSGINWAG